EKVKEEHRREPSKPRPVQRQKRPSVRRQEPTLTNREPYQEGIGHDCHEESVSNHASPERRIRPEVGDCQSQRIHQHEGVRYVLDYEFEIAGIPFTPKLVMISP